MASTRAEAREIVLETNEVLDANDVPAPRELTVVDASIHLLYKHAYGPYMYLSSSKSQERTAVDNQI